MKGIINPSPGSTPAPGRFLAPAPESPSMPINREWIAAELSKGIDAEQESADDAKGRAETPPDPSLGVLYHEIAEADERHRLVVEAIATRYGHTPTRGLGGGIGEAIGRFREKVAERMAGATPMEKVAHDLSTKANAIHWYQAWIHAFDSLGEVDSVRELTALLVEEEAHRDALQSSLGNMVTSGARLAEPAPATT